jgi:hypothetical protein
MHPDLRLASSGGTDHGVQVCGSQPPTLTNGNSKMSKTLGFTLKRSEKTGENEKREHIRAVESTGFSRLKERASE